MEGNDVTCSGAATRAKGCGGSGARERWWSSAGWLAGLLGMTAAVPAQAQELNANFAVERFRLATDSRGILDVEWAEVLPRGAVEAAIWVGGQDDPLILRRNDDLAGRLVDYRVGGEILAAFAPIEFFQLGIVLPVALSQGGDQQVDGVTDPIDRLQEMGVGDLRLAPKIQLLRQEDHFVSVGLMVGIKFPTSEDDNYFGHNTVVAEPEVLVSRDWGAWRTGLNLGYRTVSEVQSLDLSVNDEFYGRLGVAYDYAERGGPPVEVNLSFATAFSAIDPFDSGDQTYAEILGGARYDLEGWPVSVIAGGGIGLSNGFGTPDYRAFLGARLTDAEPDADSDGLPDDEDRCPSEAEDRDDFEDSDGCPDPDNDRDGVLDAADGDPLKPEDRDGFEDADGVPDPDNDQDGILDVDDKCPDVAGEAEAQGCPNADADEDGIYDALDGCAEEPEDRDGFEDQDGCPDPDNDKDGIGDSVDKCPMKAGPAENRGCPDTDRDNDSVVDRLDNCPDEAGTPENQGCKKKQLVQLAAGKIDILERVYFQTAKADIESRSFELLNNVARVLKAHPEIKKVRIEGHTDDRGSEATNQRLSQRRAESVRAYLVKAGIDQGRLEAVGVGEARPIASNDTSDGRATNRRVEFVIAGDSSGVVQ